MPTDPSGDIFGNPPYTGPNNADLDVISGNAVFRGDHIDLIATMDADIGSLTPGGVYVWGVDRGLGAQVFTFGPGILFDSVIVLNTAAGPGNVVTFIGAAGGGAVPFKVSGPTITVSVPTAFLPTNGLDPRDYRYSFWPRSPGAGNDKVSDFLPDASTFAAAIPEPGTWGLAIVGLGLTGLVLRRRQKSAASVML